jgi:hypothetical protein
MAAIYSNGGNRWNILGFNFTKRDALSSLYKISMMVPHCVINFKLGTRQTRLATPSDSELKKKVDLYWHFSIWDDKYFLQDISKLAAKIYC